MDFDLRPFALFALTDAQKLALVDALLKDAEWRAFISKTNAKGQGEDHPRAMTEAHFAKITTQLDGLEQQAKDSLRATLTAIREALLKQVRKEFGSDPKWINALGLPKRKELTQGVRNMLRGAFERGSGHARYEITGRAEYDVNRLGMKPKAALRYLDQKAFWITGVLSDDLLKKSKAILYQALKNGEPLEGTIVKLRDAFIPYLGDERAIEDDEQLQPHRLETIVRTNTTEAYNEGRLTEMRDPDLQEYLAGIEYSAIIDQRTTEVCQHLDGKVFRPDDPDIEKFTPPNHFNCRSLLVPVLIDEPPDIGDFITPSDKGRAEELMDEGFGGSSKFSLDYGEWNEEDHPRDEDGKFASGGGGGWTKIEDSIVAFHGTAEENLAQIRKEGILARSKLRRGFKHSALYEDERGRSVFVAESKESAAFYARYMKHNQGSAAVVLELRIPKSVFEKFKADFESDPDGRAAFGPEVKPEWIVGAERLGKTKREISTRLFSTVDNDFANLFVFIDVGQEDAHD